MELQHEKFYTEEEYEKIEYDGLVEYDNGKVYFQARPIINHQRIMAQIMANIVYYLRGKKCEVFSEIEVRLECDNNVKRVVPDISVICDKNKLNDKACNGAPDFIIEIVSKGNRMHDYAIKITWYKNAGVREYWIVDSYKNIITVYLFDTDDVEIYDFKNTVPVAIWDGLFSINFSELDLN